MLDKLMSIHKEYERLQAEADRLDNEMIALKGEGMADASPYWIRKDDPNGKPDQLELTHKIDSDYYQHHNSRREYIGVKPDNISAALGRIDRYNQWLAKKGDLNKIMVRLDAIIRQTNTLEYITFSKQSIYY